MAGEAVRRQRMLDLAMAVLQAPEPHDPWPLVVRELTGALSAAAGVHAQLTARGGTRLRVWTAGEPEASAGQTITHTPCADEHPHLRHFATRADDSAPRTMTDLLSDRVWRRHPVYTGSCGDYDGLRQVSMPLAGPGGLRSIVAVGRSGGDFTDDDRAYLRHAQPLLAAVWTHVVHLDRWRARLTEPASARRRAADRGVTPRELAVLHLLTKGLTAQGIARRLSISPHTVHNHLAHLYRKLEARDRLDAVLRAQALGLLPAGGEP